MDDVEALVSDGLPTPERFRAMLGAVPVAERDAWLDRVLGIDDVVPDDGPELPRGCVPYLPCPVDTILPMLEHAQVSAADVFVDVGSGLGRAAALARLWTGAAAIGIEIQSQLVQASRPKLARLGITVVQGDAADRVPTGSVYFLYCPFGGERLDRVLADLEAIARTRTLRVGCVDLPLPARDWLRPAASPVERLTIYRSA